MGKRVCKKVKEITGRSLRLAEIFRGQTFAWLVSTIRNN